MNKYREMINVVLLPEIFDAVVWPVITYPTCSIKENSLISYEIDDCVIRFYPGLCVDELSINEKKSQVSKYLKYFEEYFVYACSVSIEARVIYYNNKVYKGKFRIIYQPLDVWINDVDPLFNLSVKELKSIKICRHIQFIPKLEYKELFLSVLNKVDKSEIDKYKNYMSIYNYAA